MSGDDLDWNLALLLCVGPSGLSPWVQEEYRAFLGLANKEASRVLVPVLLPRTSRDDAALPLFASGREWADLTNENEWAARLPELVAAIRGERRGPSAPGKAVPDKLTLLQFRSLLDRSTPWGELVLACNENHHLVTWGTGDSKRWQAGVLVDESEYNALGDRLDASASRAQHLARGHRLRPPSTGPTRLTSPSLIPTNPPTLNSPLSPLSRVLSSPKVMHPSADITLQVLERIQRSIVDLRDETRAGITELGTRLDGVDTTLAEHGALLSVLHDHASTTNEHLASLDQRVSSLEHHATATNEVLGLLHTRLGFFERASTIATEGRARLETRIDIHDDRLTRVEARLEAIEKN